MNVQEIANIISTVGFPIAIACYMLWYNNKTMTKMQEALNNNTLALQKLAIKLDKEDIVNGNQE